MSSFTDDRGRIIDLLVEPIDSVTLITTRVGKIRGNHYHRETRQYTYIVEGKLRLASQKPGGPVQMDVAATGDLVCNDALERHAWQALKDTTCLVFTRGPRSGPAFESDTIRLVDDERLLR